MKETKEKVPVLSAATLALLAAGFSTNNRKLFRDRGEEGKGKKKHHI